MKKYLILTCVLAASTAFASAVRINGSAKSSDAPNNSVISSEAGDDVILDVDPTLNNKHFFGKSNNVMRSLVSNASEIHFFGPYKNGANSGIVDIATENNVEAISIFGKFWMNLANLTITNSTGGKKGTADLSFGSLEIMSEAAYPSTQTQGITFENVKADVTTIDGAKIGSSGDKFTQNTASINVAASAEVVWHGNKSVEQNGIINVMGSYTNENILEVKNGGQIIINNGATCNLYGGRIDGYIAASGALNFAGSMTIANGSNIDVMDGGNVVFSDNTNFGKTSVINISGGTVVATKDLEFGSILSTGGTFSQTTGDGVKIIGNSSLSDNGVWNIKGKVQVSSGASFTLDNNNLNFTGNGRFIVSNAGTITLNQMYKKNNVGGVVPIVFTGSNSGTLIIGGDISLDFINNTNGKAANIVLANEDAVLRLVSVVDSLKFQNDNGLAVFNFRENAIYVGDTATEAELALIKLYSSMDSSSYLGTAKVVNGWLTAAIPEPAEWAAIFGGIAFALAVYRRKRA